MDVARSIPVSIMMYAAHRTIPFTNAQVFHLSILITAIRTNLTGRKEFVYFDNSCASLPAYIPEVFVIHIYSIAYRRYITNFYLQHLLAELHLTVKTVSFRSGDSL